MDCDIQLDHVSKRYRSASDKLLATTLKSYLLYDLWRRPRQNPSEAETLPWALDDVSFQCPRGATTGIIGPNGAGKSTLLKMLAGISKPDVGTLSVSGRVAALIELGAGFHPELTGRENILINGVLLGMRRRDMKARAGQIIAFAELGDFIDRPVRTYSSGMYARLGFAVAIHVDPDILLIDEILSVGDAAFTRKCQAALEGFRKAQKTIVLVSHDLATVRSWCDFAVWLEGGRVKQSGPAPEVVDGYLASVAAQAIGGV